MHRIRDRLCLVLADVRISETLVTDYFGNTISNECKTGEIAMKRIKKISVQKRDQANRTIHSLQRKLSGIAVCPHCGQAISKLAIQSCDHCDNALVWYMDVVGKPGEEELCKEEYKAKMIVRHPELASTSLVDLNRNWMVASSLSFIVIAVAISIVVS